MKSANPTPQRPARPRGATPAPDRKDENLTRSRRERGAPQSSASAHSAPPRANNSGKDRGSRGDAENAEDLPEGWTSAPLDALVEFNPKHPATLADDTPVSFIPMPAVSETSPVLDVSQTRPLGSVRKGYTHFADGDVLFAKITPCMENGKGAVASGLKNGLGCGTTELVVMRSRGAVDPLFLYRFLAQPSIRSAAKDSFTGSAGQARVPASFLKELATPIPPLAEQRRIVAKLEELLGKVEASRQRLAQVPSLLKRFRQAVLAAACSGRLTADWRAQRAATVYPFAAESPALAVAEDPAPYGRSVSAPSASPRANDSGEDSDSRGAAENAEDLPDGWNWRSVEELAKIGSGQSSAKVIAACQEQGDIAWFKVSDMNLPGNEKEMITSRSYLSEASAQELRMRRFPSGTIVFPKRGGAISTNKKRFLPKPSCIDMNLMALTPTGCDGRYFWLWFLTIDLGQMADGSSVPQINNPDILPLQVPVPPLPEQEEIVRRVEAMFAVADRLEARFETARAQVDRLAPALLAKAFRGELVPQDPRDPPASALLAQLCGEK